MPVRGLFDARLVGVEARDWVPARTRSMTRSVGGRGWCSGAVAVSVDKGAEDLAASHVSAVGDNRDGTRIAVVGRCRGALLERSVWSMLVVVLDVLVDDASEMTFAEDEDAIQAFAAYGPDPAFRECVRDRRAGRAF